MSTSSQSEPQKDVQKAYRSRFLGLGYLDKYKTTRDLADLEEAASAFKEAVALMPENHERLPVLLNGLGVSLRLRFEGAGNLADISQSIVVLQRAVELTLEEDTDKPFWLYDLGTSLMLRFGRSGQLSDISEAIAVQRKAIELSPDNSPSLAFRLNSLGLSLTRCFEHTGNMADISEAIAVQQKAVRLSLAEDSATLAYRLNSLGNSLMRRFQHTGVLTDISQSIAFQRSAIGHIPETDANTLCPWLDNLGAALVLRFLRTGDLEDVSESISIHRRAIELSPEGHPNLPALLHHLGGSLMHRFIHTENLADISESISVQQNAVQLLPEDHAWLPALLESSGNSLMRRFERTGHLNDIAEAIAVQRRAVDLTPERDARLSSKLNNLANSLRTRFQREKRLDDISEAISLQQRAVEITPESRADLHIWLSNLGVSLSDRFHHKLDMADISEAISIQQKAVQLTPEGRVHLPARLNNLGNAFFSRYQYTKNIEDLSEAISVQQRAVNLSPTDHPDLPVALNNLGRSLEVRFELLQNKLDLRDAVSNYCRAANSSLGSISHRLWGAQKWAKLSKQFDPSQRLRAWATTIDLASQIAGLEYTIQERYTFLLDISELSASAAAAAFDHGKPDLALEWLEQGRCLVWRQINNLRTPVDVLRSHNAELADEVVRVSKVLESAASRAEPLPFTEETTMLQKMAMQSEALAHVRHAEQWNELLKQVRAIPGFEDFLRPPRCQTLMQTLPKEGQVVFINVHHDRCDALALISGEGNPLHIPLPEFSYQKAGYLRKVLASHLRNTGLRMRGFEPDGTERGMRPERLVGKSSSVIKELLRQLWDFVVKPILDRLGLVALSPESATRIWWCATGPVAFLPIHAAGIYGGAEGVSLSDFAVSSFIPSVTVLAERLQSHKKIDSSKTGLLLISQPATPGQRPIPGTTKEARAIEILLKAASIPHLCLDQASATLDEGIKQMEAFSCVHFACHASQDDVEPLKSSFYLHDGPLELSTIIKRNMIHADLAFLAACQTSTGDEKLSEEAVHLAAGMLAAGYRGVIATMWSISDAIAPRIARHFYSKAITYTKSGSDEKESLSGVGAARALHSATLEIRKELEDTDNNLLSWIPYVHFGI